MESVPVLHSPRQRSLTAAHVTVFFLPASHSTVQSFMKIAEMLSDEFSTVVVGRPSKGASHSNDRLHEIRNIFEHFGTDMNVLVGHGDGGNLAIRLSCVFTKKQVDAVALIGCGLEPPSRFVLRRAPLWLLECLWPMITRRGITREFHSSTTEETRREAIAEAQLMTAGGAQALLNNLRWFNTDTARGILAPVTVMTGECDTICPPKEAAKLAKVFIKGRRVIIKEAGFRAHEEKPKDVTSEVERLIAAILARGPVEVDNRSEIEDAACV